MNFIFDIDDTLYDQKDIFEGAYRKIFGDGDELPIGTLFVRSQVRSHEVFAMVEAGELPPEKMYAYRVCKAFEDCGATLSEDRAMAFQGAYARNQATMQLLPGIIRILDWLKARGAVMGIITNGPGPHQRRKIEALGLKRWFPEESFFIRGEMGVAKPDTGAFRMVEERLGIDGGQSVFIGDAYHNDVLGAKNAGWQSIWVNRRRNPLPKDVAASPDFIIQDEDELMAVVAHLIHESDS